MSKAGVVWCCQECGSTAPKWVGRCADCGQFNTFVEEKIRREEKTTSRWVFSSEAPKSIADIDSIKAERQPTGIAELDRVLGGGIVSGSLILLGGEPGVGKSTLLMQAAGRLADSGLKVLMVSGEESVEQIKLRADRLNVDSENLLILAEIAVDRIQMVVETTKPDLLIVDSIQTLYHPEISSAPGSVSQVRECAGHLMRFGKGANVPVFIIGHVTKEGTIAGPRLLEHMVDTVLYFDGGTRNSYRLVRAVKNRFGTANELAVFSMSDTGLVGVDNPSALFLAERPAGVAGSVVAATIEGTRPLLVELQALITPSRLSMPRRLTAGVDYNRSMITLAVLERRAGVRFDQSDIYLNIAGGVKVNEPALDLALALAVVSAGNDRPIDPELCAFGEIGLAGEIRFVANAEDRIKEAVKLGFKKIVMPDQKPPKKPPDINLIVAKTLQAALEQIS